MNARSYRVNLNISPFDFPAIVGLGQSSLDYQSEPHINKMNIVLTITKKYVLSDINTNKTYDVLSVKSDYEIPSNLIKSREDVYEFYKDAVLSLNEAFQGYKYQMQPESASLPNIVFPNIPIENYKVEIDRVFNLLNSQN